MNVSRRKSVVIHEQYNNILELFRREINYNGQVDEEGENKQFFFYHGFRHEQKMSGSLFVFFNYFVL